MTKITFSHKAKFLTYLIVKEHIVHFSKTGKQILHSTLVIPDTTVN